MKNAPLSFVGFWVIALLVSASMSACEKTQVDLQQTQNEQAIINGREANLSEIGATVALLQFGQRFCTGTLIAPQVVLTAAHCLEDVNAQWVEVASGVIDSENAPSSRRMQASRIVAHNQYDPFFSTNDQQGLAQGHDIGLVLLQSPITDITPSPILDLGSFDQNVSNGSPVVISGYGVTSVNGQRTPPLQIATTSFIRRSATEILAGGRGTDTCFGDSGGPIYVELANTRYVVGATSRGAHDSQIACGENGIYTFASAYTNWIEQNADGKYVNTGAPIGDNPVTPTGECAGNCGEVGASGSCWCDAECLLSNDCCDDFQAACIDPPAEEPAEEPVDEPAEEPVDEPLVNSGTCNGACTGQSAGECWCDPECVATGDCCDDFDADACTEIEEPFEDDEETTEQPSNDENDEENPTPQGSDETTNENDAQNAGPQSTGVWTCDLNFYIDEICHCGCGIVDPACETQMVDSCDEVVCSSGLVNGGNNAACEVDTRNVVLSQGCNESGNAPFYIASLALLVLGHRRTRRKSVKAA